MTLGMIEDQEKLAQIQATLAMGENEDAAGAFRSIVAMLTLRETDSCGKRFRIHCSSKSENSLGEISQLLSTRLNRV
jgi:hypothetical protein